MATRYENPAAPEAGDNLRNYLDAWSPDKPPAGRWRLKITNMRPRQFHVDGQERFLTDEVAGLSLARGETVELDVRYSQYVALQASDNFETEVLSAPWN